MPEWPVEYGGTSWSLTQNYIFAAENAKAGAPPLPANAVNMVGPILIEFGTKEQKDYYLPRIRSGQDWWAQGYSEPNAGSDLANLKTRAVRDGDHYVINGSKIWTTHAHWADHIFCLVRTNLDCKPQQGISFLVFDIRLPGITIRPLITISGEHEVNEVFFENVRVPVTALVGEENAGWTVAKSLLTHERLLKMAPQQRARFVRLRDIAGQEPDGDGARLIDDMVFITKLADAETALDALEMSELRILARLQKGDTVGAESSYIKTCGTRVQQLLTEIALEASAYYGIPSQPTASHVPHADECVGPAHGIITTTQYLADRAASIYAGSDEIQRNIIAKQVLKL